MSLSKKHYQWGAGAAAFATLCVLGVLVFVHATDAVGQRAHACAEQYEYETEQIDCWYTIIRDTFEAKGTEAAFEVFERIYREHDAFSDSGCHRHAHRVGDMAYYFNYLAHRDLSQTAFPPNANACGYGFYHGFFEHLVQDRPDPAFVTEVCTYMTQRLEQAAPAISPTCYHGSGHGFTLARADTLVEEHEWSISAFIDEPLRQCESLPEATDRETSECRQGVYNVLVDWMADEEYGFSYNDANPFAMCDREPHARQHDCYYEMAQKLDFASNMNPANAAAIVSQAQREDLHGMVLNVALAGMVQHDPKGSQRSLMNACRHVRGALKDDCIGGIVSGLVEHNTRDSQYEHAFAFCGEEMQNEEERTACHRTLRAKMDRFYSRDRIDAFCEDGTFPHAFCAYYQENVI